MNFIFYRKKKAPSLFRNDAFQKMAATYSPTCVVPSA